MFRFLLKTICLLGLVCSACSPQISAKNALQEEVYRQISAFRHAVESRNARVVYAMMSDSYKMGFDERSFADFFQRHYENFVEYAYALDEDRESFRAHAVLSGDPCASMTLEFDEQGNWKIAETKDQFASEDEQKRHLIMLLQSSQFSAVLSEFAKLHPELTSLIQRNILRSVVYDDLSPEHIVFSGHQALIVIPDKVQLSMTCTGAAWRLDRCVSLR